MKVDMEGHHLPRGEMLKDCQKNNLPSEKQLHGHSRFREVSILYISGSQNRGWCQDRGTVFCFRYCEEINWIGKINKLLITFH